MKKTFELLKTEDYLKFYKSLHDAKIANKHGCFVSLDRPDAYAIQKNFLLDDGVAGFSLADGDLVAVHKNPILAKQKGYNHIAGELLFIAIENGANSLDCYGKFLTNMYMQYGFLPTGKMKFDITYNPSWNTLIHGEPDVIAMCRAVKDVEELMILRKNNKMQTYSQFKDLLPEYNDYMQMLDDRNKILKHIQNNNLSYFEASSFIKEIINENQK